MVEPNDTQTLRFLNTPANTLTIEKYADTGTGAENAVPLKGVTFLITDSSGAAVGGSNGEHITDENDRIVLDDLIPGTTIIAREVKTVEGYVLDGEPKSVLIKEGEAQVLRFYNKMAGTLVVKKLDKLTGEPLAGVEFELTYAEGGFVDDANGHLSSKGLYKTDGKGEIRLSGITGTIVIKETKCLPGYTMDPATSTQTVTVNPVDTQTITVYNTPIGGVEIIKVDDADHSKRLANVTFEIRKMDDGLVDTVTTDKDGHVQLSLEAGSYYAVETQAAEGYCLDDTPHYFTVEDGKPTVVTVTTGKDGRVFVTLEAGSYYAVETVCPKEYKLDDTPHYFEVKDGEATPPLTITNRAFSGILLHKIDSITRKGIYGVTFLLYDGNMNPVDQFTTDQNGYAHISTLDLSGKVFLRELENKGYIPDEQLKTVYVKPGQTTEITWENTPITGQIQIVKKSADYNPTNGLPEGTLLEGAVFEIYDKANNLVDTLKSDSRGLAVSRQLPLDRYSIREVKAPANYGVNDAVLTAYLEHEGQIVRFEVTNKSLTTGVSITKTGPKEVMGGQPVRYVFDHIANNSSVRLDSFYWRDTLPAEVILDTVVTGTYNRPGNYKIVYRVNGGEYQTLADNLSTARNYTLAASPVALGLAANERVTETMFVFGQAPAGFAQVEKPYLYCTARPGLPAGAFVNRADVGGVYNKEWIQAVSRWVTTVYGKTIPLPRTGY